MKRLILALYLALICAPAMAQVSIPSGTVDQYVPFVAVDSGDKVTRETGLSSFTVYRKRENGTVTAMTTPTVVEHDSTNMPGAYSLLLDEDTTIGAGNDNEVMTLHVTHAGMEPVTMTVNLYRPKLTAGQTLTISGGSANAAVQSVASNAITAAAIADGAIDLATFATDANPLFGILRRGTAQSATSTTLVLDSGASFADDVPIGSTLVACGSTQGYCQSRLVTDYTGSSDTATVSTWPVTPSGTITYYVFASAPGEGGSGGGGDLTAEDVWTYGSRTLTALDEDDTTIDLNSTAVGSVAGNVTGSVGSVTGNVGGTVNGLTSTAQGHVRTAVGLASANLDTQLGAIAGYLDTEIAAILQDTGTTLDQKIDAIKAVTDNITVTNGLVEADAKAMNGADIAGDGTEGNEWRGAAE